MANKKMEPLADRLRTFRFSRDFSQKTAAAVLGVSYRTIQRAEAGGKIGAKSLYKIEEFFRKTP